MAKGKDKDARSVTSLEVPPKLALMIETVAEEAEMPKSEAMRLMMKAGFAVLRKIDFDVGEAVARMGNYGAPGKAED